MKYALITIFLSFSIFLTAQKEGTFSVSTSKSEVLYGNAFSLTFSMENIQNADFETPDFSALGLVLVGGPSQSSNMQIINGDVSSSQTITYYVKAKEEGLLNIPSFTIQNEEKSFESEPTEMTILPNPDGIVEEPIQSDRQIDVWGRPVSPKPKKKKRPTVKL